MQYEVKLSQFEGPLDLLVHLIEKSEVDIKDIFLSQITAQYLAYMQQIDSIDMEMASEFISVAATLLYIKSRSILPRPVPVADNEVDPEQVLIRQIREYKAFKEASDIMLVLGQSSAGILSKPPEEYPILPPDIEMGEIGIQELYDIFACVLLQAKQEELPSPGREVRRDEYNIAESIIEIRNTIKNSRHTTFSQLFHSGSRMKLIVTFIAMLELISVGELRVSQEKQFGEITIELKEGA